MIATSAAIASKIEKFLFFKKKKEKKAEPVRACCCATRRGGRVFYAWKHHDYVGASGGGPRGLRVKGEVNLDDEIKYAGNCLIL